MKKLFTGLVVLTMAIGLATGAEADLVQYDMTAAFYAVDINTGEVISKHNENLALTPASVQKLITTATVLEYLGPNFKFQTKVEYVGTIDPQTGILDGKIIIRGGGDPTLGSKYFPTTATHSFLSYWAKSIYDAGIKYINGEIIGDASLYGYEIVPSTWSWEDIGNYFGANAFASIMGFLFPFNTLFGSSTPWLAGLIYDHQGSYGWAFTGVSIMAFTGGILLLFAGPPKRQTYRTG